MKFTNNFRTHAILFTVRRQISDDQIIHYCRNLWVYHRYRNVNQSVMDVMAKQKLCLLISVLDATVVVLRQQQCRHQERHQNKRGRFLIATMERENGRSSSNVVAQTPPVHRGESRTVPWDSAGPWTPPDEQRKSRGS
ncbi:uncharacterized protein LOC125501705 isoform X2 [Athalia rosae]|uniref:uncharacterized protein LOC125501705 isoform X2 n=1 Tax=Athalia rosae TaxID=37344 RepID=UPI0020337C38|nr:uncharacterized protein LOC125501705 isoform X2 [Athalia rosae]